jgi:Ni/Co efflux regulator RcnB
VKNFIVVLAAAVAFSLTAAAQTSGAPAQGSADNQKASSSQAKPSKKDKNKEVTKSDASTAKAAKLTGCLSGPNDEGAYVLKNSAYKRGVEVGGADELKANVGHEVQLTGEWTTSGAAIG